MKRTEHNDEKWAFPFVKYAPEHAAGKLPLIIQLHGAGERGNGREDLPLVDLHGFSNLVAEHDYECMLVLPQCPRGTFWAARVESIIKFIQQLIREFDVDESRIYLTGLSMGGYGTWFTAMAKPELFAAIAPVCGGGMAWYADALNMPIWAFHGAQDDTVSPMQSDEMVSALKARNKNVTYSRLEGVGHNAWTYAYTAQLMQWLLEQHK